MDLTHVCLRCQGIQLIIFESASMFWMAGNTLGINEKSGVFVKLKYTRTVR